MVNSNNYRKTVAGAAVKHSSSVKWLLAAVAALLLAQPAVAQSPLINQNFDNITGANGNGSNSNGATANASTIGTLNGWGAYGTSGSMPHIVNSAAPSKYCYRRGTRNLAFVSSVTIGPSHVLLPVLSEAVNELGISLWLCTSSDMDGTLSIGYVTDNDTSTFVSLADYHASAATKYTSNTNPQPVGSGIDIMMNLTSAPSTATRIALRWSSTSTSVAVCGIDDVVVDIADLCPSVTGLTATPSYTTAALTWTEAGSATQWKVSVNDGTPVTVGTTSYELQGLTPGTNYTVKVESVCGGGHANVTPSTVSFTTASCLPVENLAAAIGYTTATLTWTATGSATSWQVSLGGGSPVTVTSPTYTFTDLTPNTDYTASVRTMCAEGLFSSPVSVNFRPTCQQPTGLAATDVTGGTLVLAWAGADGQYEVQIATNSTFTADVQTATVATASATFPNLEVGERYYARVRAFCGSDASVWSSTLSVRITDIPATGLYPGQGLVVLNDLEDHEWAYYSDPNSPAPLHSYNPADVKIVYLGNGNNVSTSSEAWPALSTFTAPSVTTISDGAAVGISQFDRRFDKFHYYQTLERLDGKTAATPAAATGRCAYRTIFNPFSLRPVYGTSLPSTAAKSNCRGWEGWRGFFAWRLKHVAGGAIYRAETGGSALAVGDTVGADVQVYFQPDAEDGMEVEFEALWARAWLTISYTSWGPVSGYTADRGVFKQNVGVERNFCVLQDYTTHVFQSRATSGGRPIADVDGNFPTVPVTYTSVLPNGTSNGTTKVYEALSGAALRIDEAGGYNTSDLPVRCHADTRFEYLTIRTNNAGAIHGQTTVPNSSFSADGFNFTMGRGMKHTGEGGAWADNDHGINYLWGIGRITRPDKVDQAGTHQFYTDRFEEIYKATSYTNNLSGDIDNLPGYTLDDNESIRDRLAQYKSTGRSLNYTLRLETGCIGYPLAYYGWNNYVSSYNYGNGSAKRGVFCAPHVWVTGADNHVRLILGNDYDRAREDSQDWTDAMAKDSCSLRTSVPFRGGNYYIQMPNQDSSKVMFTAVIKSGFHGYRMWRRAFDPATGNFYAGDHVTPGYPYDTTGYSGSEGKWGSGQIDYLSSSNGSLPYGFGDGGTDGDPKNIYIGVSNNMEHFKGKRYCLIEGGYLWTSISGCAWDTLMTNRDDNDVAVIRMKGGNLYGAVFGGTNTYADGAGGRQLIFTGGKVWGWISGGANGTAMADNNKLAGHHFGSTYIYVGGNFQLGNDTTDRRVGTYVNTIGRTGANDGNLFGAGCGIKPYSKWDDTPADFNDNAWKFHECGEVWNSTVVVADQAKVLYDVYGGGNYGYNKRGYSSDVRILGGHVGGKVFGGSNNKSTGSSNILMTGGTVEQGIYGGCNNWGVLLGDVNINILGGTVGSGIWPEASVFGGGYGENTTTSGNITVNIGDSTTWQGPHIWGDVYGGSQMGNVLGGDTVSSGYRVITYRINNASNSNRDPQYSTTPLATVAIDTAGRYDSNHKGTVSYFAGNIGGNIYGGGYGQNGKSATSYGDVEVRILGNLEHTDPTVSNDVYGANNLSGKPMGKVQVTIGSVDSVASGDRNRPLLRGNVYGGGNEAAYGAASTTTTLKVDMLSGTVMQSVFGGGRGTSAVVNLPSGKPGLTNDRATQVHIHNGSVRGNVYGGGNAAKVVGNTKVIIGE
ncbi:MAG: fibronectin type III domain-containing protein [Bacteroidales bacterium]|nr:fibronectin type III domain-containing protein [Bacteroidales bacterium]